MYLQSVVVVLVVVCGGVPALGYRDDSPMQKWSPEYFQYRFFPAQTTYKRRMPNYVQEYAPGLSYSSYRPSWRVGAMGTMYKRTQPRQFADSGVDRCVAEGETCLFRGGLVGAAVKLNCCPGNKCVFYESSFSCVASSDIELEKELYEDMKEENYELSERN